jgi:hypothetical protein
MPFESLNEIATTTLKEAISFEPLDPGGGDRHGAWEWTWIRPRDGGGTCYATLAALGPLGGVYDLEVSAGADDASRFGKFLVREFPHVAEPDSNSKIFSEIVEALVIAAKKATVLAAPDLTQNYVRNTAF